MSRSKTIFVLGSFAPSLINFRGPLIAEMAARGHKVIAGAPDIDADVAAGLRQLGAEPVTLDMDRTGTNLAKDLGLCRRLEALFRDRKPDVLLTYTAKPVIWGAIAAGRAGVPLIAPMITGLGYGFAKGRSLRHKMLRHGVIAAYRMALRKAHRIFFQNPDDVEDFKKLGLLPAGLDIVMINGSGVDIDHFAPKALPDEPAFLMISRLLKAKGVAEYAEAAIAVKSRYRRISFKLVGWHDASADAVSDRDMADWRAGGLEYLGHQDDVRPAIAESSVYVLPSYREGTPRSVLEAMAMGRAIITTDVPGCRETVTNGVNGLLVPPRNVDDLGRAMITLIEDAALRAKMGQSSRAIAEAKFDVRKVNEVILAGLGL